MALQPNQQVRVAYDFQGEASNEELTVREGDVLKVLFTDVGEGWIQCENANGQSGLVPEAYVEKVEATIPSPQVQSSDSGWGMDAFGISAQPVAQPAAISQPLNNFGSDPFGNDPFGFGNSKPAGNTQPVSTSQNDPFESKSDPFAPTPSRTDVSSYNSGFDSEKNMSGMTDQFQDATLSSTKKGGIFGGKNKFTDPFFIGPSPGPSHDDSIASVDSDGEIVRWAGNKESFSISVGNPEKSSKLGGMKTFIQYQITPTNTGRGVLRRYKHFDWLHEQLTRKYAAVAIIPPLPGKQASGRFDDDFVTDRMSRLQCWSVRMCRHPLMSSASVFQHFLTSSDDEKIWKNGKRQAEKDAVVGEIFSLQLKVPEEPVEHMKHQVWLAERTKHNKLMGEVVNQMYSSSASIQHKMSTSCKKDYEKLSQSAASLADATQFDRSEGNQKLLKALQAFSGEMKVVGETVCSPDNWIPLSEGLLEYRGLLHAMPQLLSTNTSVMGRLDEMRKAQISQKVSSEQLNEAKRRTDNLSYAVKAEIQYFDDERVKDTTSLIANFLKLQIASHQKAVASLQGALQYFEDIRQGEML